MNRDEFRAKWRNEAAAFRRRHVLVDAAALCEEILEDFEAVNHSEREDILSLQQAAAESGYSADHLGRLVRIGRIPNAGRPNSPKIRRRDLPLRPSRARQLASLGTHVGPSRVEIARSIVGRAK